jgi:hypothetical protein
MLPESVFEYIVKEDLIERLNEDIPFSTRAYPLINLYGVAKWHKMIEQLNENHKMIELFLEQSVEHKN